MSEKKQELEITEEDLRKAVSREMVEFLSEHKQEITRRAHQKLKKHLDEIKKSEVKE